LILPFRVGVAFLSWLVFTSGVALAHPLGNFTINHLSELAISGQRVHVRYVLDMAEIPTYQVMRSVTPDGKMNSEQLAAWARAESAALLPQLHVSAGETPLALVLDATGAHTKRGAGGLPTLYLTVDAHARLPAPGAYESRTFSYTDETFAGRLGWRDVVVAPATEPTRELNQYPNALIGSPRELTSVEVALSASGVPRVTAVPDVTAATSGPALPGASQVRSNQLSDMLARGTGDWGFVALTFLVAIALGALHALEPGHGKTLLAISLVGARATVRQATILALALTFAHTIGVLALGVAINLFKGYFVPETIYPWITLLSGVVIAIIGARAVQKQIENRRPLAHVHVHAHAATHDHVHEHVHEPHGHGHHTHPEGAASHAHDDLEHARAHAIPGTAPLRFGGTVWAAMSGGVAPCPAALVVLLAALALNEVAYGTFVIVAFSFGLAATLTGLGIAVVRGASWLQGRKQFERFVTYGPLVSATVISLIGAVMVGQGFAERGVSVSPVVVSAITVLAITGYAFSHPFAHRRNVEIA
jgi:ABC-type nickel/cobalt efflux system permease component RcnA